MSAPRFRGALLTTIVVGIVLSATWLSYQPALGGTFLLDDISNLGGLQNVDDKASALHFVLSGTAGPVGRPLALASFLPQAAAWEQGAAPFLAVNIAIHLLNGCLLGSFLYLLTRARGVSPADSRYVALAAMSLWLFMPLLASSSLMVVQRMTTMSATFVFLGLNGYLLARSLIERRPNRALWGMSMALVAATSLATLTKESGVLLPVLVLVIESTLLSRPSAVSIGKWRTWISVVLVLPTAFILAYLATRLPYSEELVLRRQFNGWERLLTEARILWEYLLNGFIPRPGYYGPFHDVHPVARTLTNPATLIAVIGWLVVIALAITWRKRYPIFAFAALWFIAGHLLESTTLALELYFEHRNYVPMVGPIYGFCAMVVSVPARYYHIARLALPLYILVNAFFTFSLSSLWGNPTMAARHWYEHHPDSGRAATTMATRQLETHGAPATIQMLKEFVKVHPEQAYLGIPALSLSCIVAPEEDHEDFADSISTQLPTIDFSYTASRMLSELLTTISRTECKGVSVGTVESLAHSINNNPRYRDSPHYQQLHHQILARVERQVGDVEGTLRHLNRAIAHEPSVDLNMMVVTTLVSEGKFADARGFIEQARQWRPLHPLRRYFWNFTLDELSTYVSRAQESYDGDDTRAREEGAN